LHIPSKGKLGRAGMEVAKDVCEKEQLT
jgi:hypothetical protein